jgi:hypothetical protein
MDVMVKVIMLMILQQKGQQNISAGKAGTLVRIKTVMIQFINLWIIAMTCA